MSHVGRTTGHLASRLETRVQAVVGRGLRRGGWAPRVTVQTGYGLAGSWVRVLARVTLEAPDGPAATTGESRGGRRFVEPSAAGVPVVVRVGAAAAVETVSDREGYVDERIAVAIGPGWASAQVEVDGESVTADLWVVAGPRADGAPDVPEPRGLLSDVDDTVMITMLPRPLVAFRNAFLRREDARRPVPGMAELYAAILREHPDTFVVYLSTGAWNVAPALRRFLRRHHYPAGPALLTDWGPTPRGWFRSGQEHKRASLRRLFDELPHLEWLLVGDDGQHDPSLYAEVARAHPGRVRGVVIRELSPGEQVATHGGPSAPDGHRVEPAEQDPVDVVTVRAPDGHALLVEMREHGLLRGA